MNIIIIPEPIMNEHPVTIYPGRTSPSRRVPPRTLPGSIERHREVCRKNGSGSGTGSDSSNQSSPEKHFYLHHGHGVKSPSKSEDIRLIAFNSYGGKTNGKHRDPANKKGDDSEDDHFSEDSLEGDNSLPPPAPPTIVPPPPSLSAPVTPSKRHSIAWEINLDDPSSMGDPLARQQPGSTRVGSFFDHLCPFVNSVPLSQYEVAQKKN